MKNKKNKELVKQMIISKLLIIKHSERGRNKSLNSIQNQLTNRKI